MSIMNKSMADIMKEHCENFLATSPKIRAKYRQADADAILEAQGSVSGTDGKHVILPPSYPKDDDSR